MEHPIKLSAANTVIMGQTHNPSILNPDFLWRNRIVPEQVALAKDPPVLNTPLASQCIFENGLHIVSEPNKISFIEKTIEQKEGALCYDAAKKYLRTVPLVHYIAVGINFSGFCPTLDSTLVPHDMLNDNSRSEFEGVSPSAEIILTYLLARRTVNLNINSGEVADSGNEQKIIFRGNFHHDIQSKEGESHNVAIAIVDDWKNDLDCFKHLISNITETMGKQ